MPGLPISTRLPEWLDGELRRDFTSRGEGPSEGMRRVAEEWWALERFPRLEFRDGPAGRRAAIRGGPDIWELIQFTRASGGDAAQLNDHFSWVDPDAVAEALTYYERFPAGVDALLAEQERVGRLLRNRR